MSKTVPQWPNEIRQSYVERFALAYCLVTLSFSAYFTPQGFNFKVALIVNTLLFLIGAPRWFRGSRLSPYALNVLSQLSNAGASVWICSFLGPTSHINLVAIPQFILALMMFSGIHPKTTFFSAALCLWQLSLPLFPFVDSWYAHKRMPENELVFLREFLDITVFGLSTYQFKIISEAWANLLKSSEQEKSVAQNRNEWRKKLLRILSHDIKEPMVHSLVAARNLKKRVPEEHVGVVNQIESAQISIKEMISNIELSNQELDAGEQSIKPSLRPPHSLFEVSEKLLPWFESRLSEKKITLCAKAVNDADRIEASSDNFIYQVFMNLLSNAVKFTPTGGTIQLSTTRGPNQEIIWRIQDSGGGILPGSLDGNTPPQVGTEGERGSGLGLKIARSFAEQNEIALLWLSPHLPHEHPSTPKPATGTAALLIQKNRRLPS